MIMKKSFLVIAAMATLVACNNEEVMDVAPKTSIAFGDAFVENSTRAIDGTLNTNNLTSFNVYGSVTGDGNTVNIFSGVEVKKTTDSQPSTGDVTSTDGNWWYAGDNTQYWIVGNAYSFAAVVNGDVTEFTQDARGENNMPTKISYDATDQKDLLYATASVTSAATSQSDVKFTFDHLLAKAQFTFTNTMTSNTASILYQYRVTDVKITNAYMLGVCNVENYGGNGVVWTASATDAKPRTVVSFGNIDNATATNINPNSALVGAVATKASATSHYQKLLIPNTYEDLIITCKIETLLNGVVIDTKLEHTINPALITLEAGKAYNFIISKGNPGEPIKFALEKVNNWDPETGGTDTSVVTPTPSN